MALVVPDSSSSVIMWPARQRQHEELKTPKGNEWFYFAADDTGEKINCRPYLIKQQLAFESLEFPRLISLVFVLSRSPVALSKLLDPVFLIESNTYIILTRSSKKGRECR